jgi:hypothetical protein
LNQSQREDLTVPTDRRTRFDDKLFVALLLLPAVFAGARFLESQSQMDQIALRGRLSVVILARAPASNELAAGQTSIVHRF